MSNDHRLNSFEVRTELQALITRYRWTAQIEGGEAVKITLCDKSGASMVGVGADESEAFANLCNGTDGNAHMRNVLKRTKFIARAFQ